LIHAIIDIGSNTIRLAVYDIESGEIELLMKKKHTVGLAAYIKDGMMKQDGIEKTCEILQEFKYFLDSFQITEIIAFTTAALRNVQNSQLAVAEIIHRTGIALRVLSGDEEARLDFIGATHDSTESSGLLIDIGGASTEIVAYEDHKICKKISLPIGSLYLHTKYVADFLPSPTEAVQMMQEVKQMIARADDFKNVSHLNICGIGGTFKGTVILYNQLFQMNHKNVEIPTGTLLDIVWRFTRTMPMPSEEAVILMKTVPERIHTIIPGIIIASVLAQYFGSEKIIYSDSGVREGYIYDQIIGQ
jgi:exopolyphosphatase/guanosine-5'-triphosphate,3'-diphosphate pyrophosphatase